MKARRIGVSLAGALLATGCGGASVEAPRDKAAPSAEFVYVDSGGHSSFVTNGESQQRIREFVGSSGMTSPGEVKSISTSAEVDGVAIPVEVQVFVPDDATGVRDVVVLLHGTIESATTTPQDSAAKFIEIARGAVKLSDRVLVSVAYPQDAIPLSSQSAFGDVGGLLFGDNLLYARAAMNWVRAGLPVLLASGSSGLTIGRVFLFGHSQGGYLAHRLNAVVDTDGVIANAPGPIDLLDRCRQDELGPNDNLTCNKLEQAAGPTTTHADEYAKRSLIQFLEGNRSNALFLQAVDDSPYQVDLMHEFEAAFRAANP